MNYNVQKKSQKFYQGWHLENNWTASQGLSYNTTVKYNSFSVRNTDKIQSAI